MAKPVRETSMLFYVVWCFFDVPAKEILSIGSMVLTYVKWSVPNQKIQVLTPKQKPSALQQPQWNPGCSKDHENKSHLAVLIPDQSSKER